MKNTRREESRVWLRIVYQGGEYELGVRQMAAACLCVSARRQGQTVTIDVGEILEGYIGDIEGRLAPRWVERGQVEWEAEDGVGSVLGQVTVDGWEWLGVPISREPGDFWAENVERSCLAVILSPGPPYANRRTP